MTKKYKYVFYILLSVLFSMVPINCGRISPRRNTYTSQASRRQEGPPPGPPPGGPPDEPPEGPPGEEPDGPPPGTKPAKPPARPAGPPENPDRPKPPDEEPEPTEDPDDANSEKPLQTVKVTDLPQEAVDDALKLDYGRYTTMSFHYEAKQWMYSQPIDICYDDYTKCYTSICYNSKSIILKKTCLITYGCITCGGLETGITCGGLETGIAADGIAPMPVCIMYSTHVIKTVNSYCDAYFHNCKIGYRYFRIVGYGKCFVEFFGYPHLEDV